MSIRQRLNFQLEKLEPRLLFSAEFAPLPIDPGLASNDIAHQQPLIPAVEAQIQSVSEQQAVTEVIVVDTSVENYQRLLDEIIISYSSSQKVLLLDSQQDGIGQISAYLAQQQNISALHIISHGSDGEVVLGNSQLNLSTLEQYADSLVGWRSSFNSDADLLLYGCELTSGAAGQDLVSSLALLTGADVAASDDLTGHSSLGGNWQLETTIGQIETMTIVGTDNWRGVLATDVVSHTVTDAELVVKSDQNWGQTFTHTSGNGSYEVDQISVMLSEAGGDDQDITLSLREAWNGTILGSNTVTLGAGSSPAAWFAFDIGNVTLTDGTEYFIQLDSSKDTGDVGVAYNGSDGFAAGTLIDYNGNPDAGKDLAFKVTSTNEAPTTTGIADVTVLEDAVPTVFDLAASFDDAEGVGSLTYSVENNTNGGLVSAVVGGTNLTLNYTAARVGVADVTVRATDAGGLTVESTFTVTVQKEVSLSPVQDTYLSNSDKDINYGSGSTLLLDKSGGDQGDGRPLLQFDLSGIPSGATVTGATLILTVTGNDGSTFPLELYEVTEAWDENTATWNLAPTTDFPTMVDSMTPAALTDPEHIWDITSLVQDWIDGNKANYGIMLGSQDSGGEFFTYDSREGATPPQLVITYLESVIANSDSYATNADTPLSVAANGVLANDTLSGASSVTPGATLEYLAWKDTDGNNLWEDVTGIVNYDFDFTGTTVVRDTSLINAPPGISAAYVFDGSDGGEFAELFGALAGNPTASSVSLEFWIRPTDAIGTEIIFDTGNITSSSASLRLNGTNLEWVVWNLGGIASVSVTQDIATEIASGEFIQIVASIDPGSGTASLRIDGGTAVTSSNVAVSDWSSGSSPTGIGSVGGVLAPTLSLGADPFEGEIAAFRLYESVLSDAQAQKNYDAMRLTVVSHDALSAAGAAVTVNADGSFSYDPGTVFDSLAEGQTSVDSFDYTVEDVDGNQSTATVSITVTGVNAAPTASGTYTMTGTDENTTSASVLISDILSDASITANDIDGDTLGVAVFSYTGNGTWEYSTNGTDGWTAFGAVNPNSALLLSDTTSIRYVPDGASSETAEIDFRGWDQTDGVPSSNGSPSTGDTAPGGGETAFALGNATISISVSSSNTSPILGSIGDQTIDELTELTFTASATDADLPANGLSYSLDPASELLGMTIDANTGAFSWTPTEGQSGTHSVTITVTDDGTGNLTDFETITITVNEVNVAPVLGTIGDQTIDELTELTFTANATDADLPANGLSYRLDGASLGLGMTIDASTGAFSWTPTEGQSGSHSVTITVTDDGTGNLTDFETITITVNEVNVAPVLGTIGDQTIDELTELTFTANATDADLPANGLSYSLDGASLGLGMTIDANTGAFSWTPTEGQSGTHTVTVTVTDDGTGNLTDFETVTITVNEVNVNPVLAPIGNQIIDELTELTFTASATDSDLPANGLSYSLDGASLGLGMTIDASTGAFSWTPTEGQSGTHSVTVTVTDDGTGNLTDFETITITVNEINEAPTAVADNLLATEDTVLTFESFAGLVANDSDPDGDALSLVSFTQPVHGSLVDNGDGTLSYVADVNYFGADSFDYSIEDSSGSVATGSAFVNVIAVGDTPQVTNVSTIAGTPSELIKINRNAADGAEVTHFRISDITGGRLYLADGTTAVNNGDFITVAQGQAGLRFTPATDVLEASFNVESSEDGSSAADQSGVATARITVTPVNTGPDISEPEAEEVEEDVTEETEEEETEEEALETETVDVVVPPEISVDENPQTTTDRESTIVMRHSDAAIGSFSSALEQVFADARSTVREIRIMVEQEGMTALLNTFENIDIPALSQEIYAQVHQSFDAIKDEIAQEAQTERVVIVSSIATSVGLSAGYVVWLLQGGSLLTSVLASMPAWHLADPLSILAGRKSEDDDDESLEKIIEQAAQDDETSAEEEGVE